MPVLAPGPGEALVDPQLFLPSPHHPQLPTLGLQEGQPVLSPVMRGLSRG